MKTPRGVAQSGSALGWGPSGRRFKSCLPDSSAGLDEGSPAQRLSTRQESPMPELPTLYVCHGDEGGPRLHPCRRVQEALKERGIEYEKVIAGQGSPLPFLRKGSREGLEA